MSSSKYFVFSDRNLLIYIIHVMMLIFFFLDVVRLVHGPVRAHPPAAAHLQGGHLQGNGLLIQPQIVLSHQLERQQCCRSALWENWIQIRFQGVKNEAKCKQKLKRSKFFFIQKFVSKFFCFVSSFVAEDLCYVSKYCMGQISGIDSNFSMFHPYFVLKKFTPLIRMELIRIQGPDPNNNQPGSATRNEMLVVVP